MRNRRADKNCEIALIVDAAYVSLQPSRLPFPYLGKSDLLVKTTCACTEVRREPARRHHLEFEIAGSRNSAKVNGRDCTVVGAQQLGSSFGGNDEPLAKSSSLMLTAPALILLSCGSWLR